MTMSTPGLYAVSDLHVTYPENRAIAESLHPVTPDDWLIVAGDVAEKVTDIQRTLALLATRWSTVIWAPGNHELWTVRDDTVQLRGEERYRHLVEVARDLGVHTPEDPYPMWHGTAVAPLFVGYDYSWRLPGLTTKEDSLRNAEAAGVVCTDEFLLHPDPHPSRDAWCADRARITAARLAALPPDVPTVLANHYPLVREPTDILWKPEFAQWCGTTRTADWHLRFRATVMVYGHLHIPRTTWHDGVRFEEVSLGYPREWRHRGTTAPSPVRRILPA
nr:metallophosphoesterase [Catenuloplanes indicus]